MIDQNSGSVPRLVGVGRGHSSFIVAIQFSEDSEYIMSNDGAHEILCYKVDAARSPRGIHLEPRLKLLRDCKWFGWHLLFGYPVSGIWPRNSDSSDINCVDLSPNKNLVATAGDNGKVALFKFPAVLGAQPEGEYPGVATHVLGLCWASDSTLIASGGSGIFVWKLKESKN